MLLTHLAILFAALCAAPALATHVTCSWVPGPGSPKQYGFTHFGIAQVSDLNKTANTQQYTTLNGHDKPVVVATYNALGKQVLEVATACGDGGWFVGDSDGGEACGASASALCINMKDPANPDNCMYLAAEDDCAWPDKLASAPEKVDIWTK